MHSPADIFTLEERNHAPEDDLFSPSKALNLEKKAGWGRLSVKNLFSAINSRRTISLPRFIYALGIPQVGAATALTLAKNYGTFAGAGFPDKVNELSFKYFEVYVPQNGLIEGQGDVFILYNVLFFFHYQVYSYNLFILYFMYAWSANTNTSHIAII